jgi:predicted TIM-barrel fold metal-dependent hydrolase
MKLITILEQFLKNYFKIKNALPWLDSSVWEDEKSAFPAFAKPIETPYIRSMNLDFSLKGKLPDLRGKDGCILRYNPNKGSLDSFGMIFPEMVENRIPLSILHTDVGFDEIINFANKNSRLNVIIESGPRKIMYFFDAIEEALRKCDNMFLCTYNFCNWLGHERLVKMGFGGRLLYGSHMPAFSFDVSMGPVILGDLEWKTKCDIAGNNLRKLLGEGVVYSEEIKYVPPRPFIIDSHAHNMQPNNIPRRFSTPDMDFLPSDWVDFIDFCGIDQLYLMPPEALDDSKITCRENVQELIKYSPDRFFYLEVFNPNGDAEHIESLKKSLDDPKFLGIKIHPVEHRTNADDDKYELIYKLAKKYKKPIMTHSWEISSYNPEQYRSHPDRFRRYLKDFSEFPFVFGHAGGRPSTIDSIVKASIDFKNVYVDLAGDYYNNGLIGILYDRLGPERILFASDVDWMDPRSNLAPVLGSDLPVSDILKILRLNALKVFNAG